MNPIPTDPELEQMNTSATPAVDDSDDITIDFSKIKRKSKINAKLRALQAAAEKVSDPYVGDTPPYNYQQLLDRCSNMLSANERQLTLYPNSAEIRNQNKITFIDNFAAMVSSIRLQNTEDMTDPMRHFARYLLQELSCGGYFSNNILVLCGKFTSSRINSIALTYVDIHVRCGNCRSFSTKLYKNVDLRKYALTCLCGSERTLPTVKDCKLENIKKIKK